MSQRSPAGDSTRACRLTAVALAMLLGCQSLANSACAEPDAQGGSASENVRLIAHDDLQGRPSYQPVLFKQGDRRLLYVGHHAGRDLNTMTGKVEANGVSIVDVTDPAKPVYLAHLPATPSDWPKDASDFVKTGGQHIQVCGGDDLPGGLKHHFYLLRNQGNVGNEIIDTTDPTHPRLVAQVNRVGKGPDGQFQYRTHKNFWECKSGIAYLPSSLDGGKSIKSLLIYDLSHPDHPRFIREFGLWEGMPGADRAPDGTDEGVHEATVYGDRVAVAYGAFNRGVLQIVDRDKLLKGDPKSADPFAPTEENLRYPVIGELRLPEFWGVHSAKPLLGVRPPDLQEDANGSVRDFLVLTSEGVTFQCDTVRHVTFMVDITDERRPLPVSNFQTPAHTPEVDYCKRGVFGPHAPNASNVWGGRVIALSYFSAGVRIVDVRDPFRPVEVGFFVPKATDRTIIVVPRGEPPPGFENTAVTNNVEVDDRGLIYAVDRADTGLHILQLTGKAALVAGNPRDQSAQVRTPPTDGWTLPTSPAVTVKTR